MGELSELISRMEKATGHDREIDAAIVAYLNDATVKRYPLTDDFGPKNRWQFWSRDGKHFLGSEGKYHVPMLTASIDATVALIERVLPGWMWGCTQGDRGTPEEAREFQGNVWPAVQPFEAELETYGYHASPAIALLIALLRAKETGR